MSWQQVRNLRAEAEELRASLYEARAEIERLRAWLQLIEGGDALGATSIVEAEGEGR